MNSKLSLFPNWKELARLIAEDCCANDATPFYTDQEIASLLEAQPGTNEFSFGWLKCREALLKKHGIDFMRVKYPEPGYKVMSDHEKVEYGFRRRFNKTRRNVRRTVALCRSVNRNLLSDDDAKAHDVQLAKSGLMQAVYLQLPKTENGLRLTIEINNDMPGILPE